MRANHLTFQQNHLLSQDRKQKVRAFLEALAHLHRHHRMKLHRDLVDLQDLVDRYLPFHLLLLQHQQHQQHLADQQVPEFLVYLEFLANLLVLEDQPFLLRLQVLADQQDLAHQLIQLHQLHPKLF